MLHHLHALCKRNPKCIIFINKKDSKDAYQCVHTWVHIAAMCMILVKEFELMLLCLPFGSAPAPGEFCLSSEMIVDLTPNFPLDISWTDHDFHIPYSNKILPPSNPHAVTQPVTCAQNLYNYRSPLKKLRQISLLSKFKLQ